MSADERDERGRARRDAGPAMPVIGRFVRVGLVVVALVLAGMMALSAFSIKVPLSSVTTTTVDGTTVTTTCRWQQITFDNLRGCVTTRTVHQK
jgi:hypothetical protein